MEQVSTTDKTQADVPKKRKLPHSVWKPGQSGNPRGSPKKPDTFSEIARELLGAQEVEFNIILANGTRKSIGIKADRSMKHGVIIAMMRKALAGDVQAAKELMDRTDGKVKDKLELSTGNSIQVAETIVTTREEAKQINEHSQSQVPALPEASTISVIP